MASLITLPVAPGVAHQIATVTLDGRRFQLRLDWIQRIRRWSLSLATEAGASIVRCKQLALRSDLLRQVRYLPEAPEGVLTVVDLEKADAEATLFSLGRRHALVYLTD